MLIEERLVQYSWLSAIVALVSAIASVIAAAGVTTKSQTPSTRAQTTLNPTPPREANLGDVSHLISSVVSAVNEYSCILYVPQHIRLSYQDLFVILQLPAHEEGSLDTFIGRVDILQGVICAFVLTA